MKNRSKATLGCPYCNADRSAETEWEQKEDRLCKKVLYDCGTELSLNKIRNPSTAGYRYQNNRFTNKCSVLTEIEGAPV